MLARSPRPGLPIDPITPASTVMLGIPSVIGTFATLTGTVVTIECAGQTRTATPNVGAYFRMDGPGNYNGQVCRASTTGIGALLGATSVRDNDGLDGTVRSRVCVSLPFGHAVLVLRA
jgi:hypothetical protein